MSSDDRTRPSNIIHATDEMADGRDLLAYQADTVEFQTVSHSSPNRGGPRQRGPPRRPRRPSPQSPTLRSPRLSSSRSASPELDGVSPLGRQNVSNVRSSRIEDPSVGAEGEPQGTPRRGVVPQGPIQRPSKGTEEAARLQARGVAPEGPIQRPLAGTDEDHPGITSPQGTGVGLAHIQDPCEGAEGTQSEFQGGAFPEAHIRASTLRDVLNGAGRRSSPAECLSSVIEGLP